MAAVLHVRLLGECSLHLDRAPPAGEPVTEVNTPRLQALLAYLLLHRDAPQLRSHLAFLFWPDSSEAQAHSNLRTLLHRLRQALPDGDQFLAVDGQVVQWRRGAPFTLDVADWHDALARADAAQQAGDPALAREALKQAIALYQGDLLPSCYDDWILPERERLRQSYLRVLDRLVRLLEDGRDYDGAIRYAQRLLRHDPLHETGYRRLMALYALQGNRAAALSAYHTCATTLQRELGVEPGAATRRAYEQLLKVEDRPAPAGRPVPGVLPLIGRAAEWAQMQAAWHRSAHGPGMVLILGEAGIGKTRLVEDLLDWAGRQGIERAYAPCYAAEGELAYAPVAALLRARPLPPLDDVWLVEVARLLPEVRARRPDLPPSRPMIEAWQRMRLFEALARAVLGDRQPLLLAVDDLHWCDRESLEWLHFLLRFDPQAPLLVAGTCRPEELGGECPFSALLPALHRDVPWTELELGPLAEAETALLAAHVHGEELVPATAARLYRETEGNPLFVVEMVRAGLDEGPRPPAAEGVRLPPRVQAVLERRLAQLSPPSRELAGLAATVGRSFTVPVLQRAAEGDEDALVRGLDELWQRRIVRERGAGAYDFAHDKLREAAYGTVSPARRRLLHRRVAQALETVHHADLDPVSRQVAGHYRRAGLPEQAIPYYLRAGQVASRLYAIDEAVTCFRQGLVLLAEAAGEGSPGALHGEMAARLYEGLGDALKISQPGEARTAYHSALQAMGAGDPLAQARLQRQIGYMWFHQGQYNQALQAYDLAETLLGAEPAEPAPAWWQEFLALQNWRGAAYYSLARWRELGELTERVRLGIERHGTPADRAFFYGNCTLVAMRRDRYLISDEILANARSALLEAQKTGDPSLVVTIQWLLGLVLVHYGALDEAEQQLQAALALADQIEYPLYRVYILTWLTVLYRKRGQVEEVGRYAARALAAGTAAKLPDQVAMAQANLGWVACRAGDLTEAEKLNLAALESWQRGQFAYPFHWTARWPLLAVALARDAVSEALEHARALLDPRQQRMPEPMAAALEQAVQAGDDGQPEAARTHLGHAVALAQELGYL